MSKEERYKLALEAVIACAYGSFSSNMLMAKGLAAKALEPTLADEALEVLERIDVPHEVRGACILFSQEEIFQVRQFLSRVSGGNYVATEE